MTQKLSRQLQRRLARDAETIEQAKDRVYLRIQIRKTKGLQTLDVETVKNFYPPVTYRGVDTDGYRRKKYPRSSTQENERNVRKAA